MIEVTNLTKQYGHRTAVDTISFTVQKGEIVGFLGPNGAGKSTTMNILAGYLSPTAGRAAVGGHDVLEEPLEVKKLLGYLPELPPLYPEMTVREFLDFVCSMKLVPRSARKADIDGQLSRVGIEEVADRLIRNLSKGYRQRVGIAQALIGNPPVLVLDEPTIGLDPRQIIEMRDLIRDLGRDHTVLLSSHILSEVTTVCARVVVIHQGRIVASEAIDGLSERVFGSSQLQVRIEGDDAAIAGLLANLPEVAGCEARPGSETGTTDLFVEAREGRDVRKVVFDAIVSAGRTVLMMRPVDRTLEEVFIQLTSDRTPGSRP